MFRLARVYDWGYDALTPDDRLHLQTAMRRRGADAWKYGLSSGVGHINSPYGSHANRAWHKFGEVAIAGLGDIPEADTWLHFAMDKFWVYIQSGATTTAAGMKVWLIGPVTTPR